MRIRRRLLAAALTLAAACSPTGEDGGEYERELAVISWLAGNGQPQAQVQVPESAQAGQPFTIVVTTWGGSCRRAAPADVSRFGLHADVAVYELHPVSGPCDRALRLMEHEIELRFTQPGTANVYVRGLGLDAQAGSVPTVVQRTLTIR